MAASFSTTAGDGVVVVTYVQPAAPGGQQGLHVGDHKFSRGQPLVLGAVEIMVGVTVLLLGISMAPNGDSLGVLSGIFCWGSLFYITAGSLTVAAGKTFSRCLINGALAVNVCVAIISFTGVILSFLDAVGIRYHQDFHSLYRTQVQMISGVLGVFHLLELAISLTIAGLACNATCKCCREKPPALVIPGPASHLPVPLPPQMMAVPKSPEDPSAVGLEEPPHYASIIDETRPR